MLGPSCSSSSAAAASSPLSPADGFLCVKDGVDGMIKYVANEPSVGLYYVQQHARASMPILLDVKDKLVEKAHEVTLHTEDMEDSICAVRSMAEFGLPLADDMIKDINKSLQIMSKAQPKRGLIQNPSWGFQSGKSSGTWDDLGATNGGSSRNYLSSMFNTAKQKASSLRWPQPDFTAKDDTRKKKKGQIEKQGPSAHVQVLCHVWTFIVTDAQFNNEQTTEQANLLKCLPCVDHYCRVILVGIRRSRSRGAPRATASPISDEPRQHVIGLELPPRRSRTSQGNT